MGAHPRDRSAHAGYGAGCQSIDDARGDSSKRSPHEPAGRANARVDGDMRGDSGGTRMSPWARMRATGRLMRATVLAMIWEERP
jgi:hypothetical protein